ncbi:copper amine oxidase N-terminal domain-containing protein [Lysinibacillus xylanilyticus]|uniref:Copper amine oxidase N-terminal domain-containing protein n=1 Tax=Lysinibacillus xylanilyticus TaxID=582475 RepID=A0ABT4EYH7_9BACI|nr:copper amine oxidase N-terminal domain-containing protein [Lysinibacillus xylanilyticus]MCY9549331.1 copper amine oxidase N-terminal domain-containing protein [Lysinibacillus xylanilyticus]
MGNIKRLVVCCLILVIATIHFGTGNTTVYASEGDYAIYNGKVTNGRLYAPIRAVGEKIKAQVSWDGATKTATVIKDKKVIKLTFGSKILKVNNEQLQMDVSLLLENGSIFLPIRYVGDALEGSTYWDKKERLANLYSEPYGVYGVTVYAQPLFYKDGYKLLDEAINKVKNIDNVAQKRQYLKPYFTDEMINLIIMRNVRFTDMSKATITYYSYPKDTNMRIKREVSAPGRFGTLAQDVLLTKRNNQWVVGSLNEYFYEFRP